MIHFFNNHTKLFGTSVSLFSVLLLFVAIFPALDNQENNAPLPGSRTLTPDEVAGKQVYISEGCVGCHSQQVRNVEVDKVWGSRPNIAADYATITRDNVWQNTSTLMGTGRTGPDLTNIGVRQPSMDWHLLHLFNPRAVVPESVMSPYPWLFEWKEKANPADIVINVPEEFRKGKKGVVVATEKALQLVNYLQSLKQVKLPDGTPQPEFLYKKEKKEGENAGNDVGGLDGAAVYAANCQSCHQANGEGLKGAFPPLKGSKIVVGDDVELFVTVIMKGYDARGDYGVMPAIGENNNLSAEEVTAIMNHERTSWGNKGKKVSVEDVKKIMEMLGSPQ